MADIQHHIGRRLRQYRQAQGLSIVALAQRSHGQLSKVSIGQWERGLREPSIDTIHTLARLLGVSPSYLLGLSDNPQGITAPSVPLLALQAVRHSNVPARPTPQKKTAAKKPTNPRHNTAPPQQTPDNPDPHTTTPQTIFLDTPLDTLSPQAFATTLEDDALAPHLLKHDVIIADPARPPAPSDYVIAHCYPNGKNLVRKYRENALNKPGCFELVALHPDWANLHVNNPNEAVIIATVMRVRRALV